MVFKRIPEPALSITGFPLASKLIEIGFIVILTGSGFLITTFRSALTVSSLIDGHYDLSGVCLGVPSIVGSRGVEKILEIPLSDSEKFDLNQSAQTLKEILQKVKKQNV